MAARAADEDVACCTRARCASAQARHAKLGGGPRPALRVVSYHADDTNRSPTFDMDLAELFDAQGKPVPYEQLGALLRRDPASSWGAYVAGCLLVLAQERGVAFPDGIAVLVCSDVPEGADEHTGAACCAVMCADALSGGCCNCCCSSCHCGVVMGMGGRDKAGACVPAVCITALRHVLLRR